MSVRRPHQPVATPRFRPGPGRSAASAELPEHTTGCSTHYNADLPGHLLGLHFRARTGALRADALRSLVATSKQLLDNIPDRLPTIEDPLVLSSPMLSRLRALLRDAPLAALAQRVVDATGASGSAPTTPEQMASTWTGAGERLADAMELLVLLHRAREHFKPIAGDATNGLRFRTWHGAEPAEWDGRDESFKSYEAVWFSRAGSALYDRLLRRFSAGYMLDHHPAVVERVQSAARRPVLLGSVTV